MTSKSTAKHIWDTLSAIDCAKQVEKKGQLSYLSWAWAWGILMENFPEAEYKVADERKISTGVGENYYAEVSCWMKIGDVERTMWLPVMDNRNGSLQNPKPTDINKAKMRCLTKCISMFGLGHYIYAGEDLPPEPPLHEMIEAYDDDIAIIISGIEGYLTSGETSELSEAAELYFETWSQKLRNTFWVAKSNGGPFTSKQREVMQSKEFKEAYYGAT